MTTSISTPIYTTLTDVTANDNNQPDTYAEVVASKVGVDADTHISQLIA